MLTPDQAARIAGIAGWERYDPETEPGFTIYYIEDDESAIPSKQGMFIYDGKIEVTPAGFFDLLRVCVEKDLVFNINGLGVEVDGSIKFIRCDIADLPNAFALAILKALEGN